MKHIHHDTIIAWAKGAEVQFRRPGEFLNAAWRDIQKPTWMDYCEYRVKPKPQHLKYRVALFLDGETYWTDIAGASVDEQAFQKHPNFVRWLTDWIEVEVHS